MPAKRIATPVKSCNKCLRAYILGEWQALELVRKRGTRETRKCDGCGVKLTLDLDGLAELDFTDSPADYANAHPDTPRVTADMVAPIATPKPPPTAAAPSGDALIYQIMAATCRRTSPQHLRMVFQWLRRIPADADAYTLGELRKLERHRW